MTSGGILPFRTYTENGIQSINSALEPNGDENVVSEFLSKPDRTFLNGCNDIILPRRLALVDGTSLAQVQTFVIPNGCDAISDIYLNLSVSKSPTNADSDENGVLIARKLAFLSTIEKVEFRVGNQIWQTMTSADLLIRNLTEHHQGFNDFNSSLLNFTGDMVGTNVISNSTRSSDPSFLFTFSNYRYNLFDVALETPANYKVFSSINLMSFSSGGSKLNSFLQYGARNNNIQIKIYYNELHFGGSSFKRLLFGGSLNENALHSELVIKRHLFTDSEKRYIENNIVNSVIKTSQSMIKYIDSNNVIDDYKTIINLDDTKEYEQTFSINCSHICFTIERNIIDRTNSKTFAPTSISDWTANTGNNNGIFYSTNNNSIYFQIYDCIKYAELIVDGASVTGKLPASYLKNCAKDLQLNVINSYPVYTIPLASTKFGNDSILLSKLSNKSLVLTFDKNQILSGKTLKDATALTNPCRVNITAIGTNVVTYVGGECSQQITFNKSYIQPLEDVSDSGGVIVVPEI